MIQLQLLIDQTAYITRFRTSKETVYLFSHPANPPALVVQKPTEYSPTRIGDAFSQAMVFEHSTDIQVFDLDVPEFAYNPVAQFVQKVLALIGYLFVLASDSKSGLLAPLASLLASEQLALKSFQSTFRLSEILRVVNLFAGRQNGKMLQPQVDSDRARLWFGIGNFYLALNRDEIFTRLDFCHGTVFHLAFNRPVKDGPNITDFGQVDATTIDPKTLRITDRLLVIFAFEFGIFSPALKEVFEGPVKVFEGLLQNLTVGFLKPGEEPLDRCQKVGRIIVIQALLMLFVMRFSLGQSHIVDKASVAKLNSQGYLLFLIEIDSEFESLANEHQKAPLGICPNVVTQTNVPKGACLTV